MHTVYVDELFMLNCIINYILLFLTKRIIRSKASQPRLLMGSIIGALYAVFMFLPHSKVFYSFAAKFLFSLALVAITYNIRKFRIYLRAVAVFYMVSFAFGGAAYALISMTGYKYLSYLPVKILATSTITAYCCILLLSSYYKRLSLKEKSFTDVFITLNGKTVPVNCFMDTGNSLYDPISDSPVMVVEYESVSPILPQEISELLRNKNLCDIPQSFNRRLRLIPYSSVGKKDGVIIGFKPDLVNINGQIIHDIVIGLCENSLSQDNTYTALANPIILGGLS